MVEGRSLYQKVLGIVACESQRPENRGKYIVVHRNGGDLCSRVFDDPVSCSRFVETHVSEDLLSLGTNPHYVKNVLGD